MDKEYGDWFYNLRFELIEAKFVEIECIFCFDWDLFTEEHWKNLDCLYKSLPEWIGYEQCPFWFGTDEQSQPFLTASVEPPGLQVYGVIQLADWERWKTEFIENIQDLPIRFIN